MERCWHGRLRTGPVRVAVLTFLCLVLGSFASISAQGITTAAIQGTVRSESGAGVDGALVRVVNLSTGYATETRVRGGGFLVQGLATGGPYRIVVMSLGYSPQVLDGLSLALGERRQVDFTLVSLSNELDTVRVMANDDRQRLPSAGGVGTSISDSSLRRLPTLNRDMYDFVRLVPQVGTRLGLTVGGASFRFNNYVIDGVSDRQLQGNNVLGPNTLGGKTISLEAVKEYQVLLSPYEVRYGAFAGMLVNAVTKSGTNTVRGSAYGYARNQHFARATSFIGSSPYRREQFGFSFGGPIVRDRLHFFIAPEFEHATAPTPGPYVGQAAGTSPALPVSVVDVTRFAALLRARGLEPGDGGRVMSLNPSVTFFARLDIALPEWRSRVVLRDNYSAVDATRFTRPEGVLVFPLSSDAWTQRTAKHTTAVQIFTQARASAFNEFVLSYMDWPMRGRGYSRSPFIQAAVSSATGVGSALLIAGPPANTGGFGAEAVSVNVADHLVFPAGSRHSLGVGADVELFRYHATGVRGRVGQWRFSNLDALANGDAFSYSLTKNFGSADAPVRGAQPGAYITDEWHVGDRLSVTLGLRADVLNLSSLPVYNPTVDSIFQRRTTDYPRTRVHWSPRLGFSLEPFADRGTRVRGGAGIFVGRPPLGWLLGPVRSNGTGVRTVNCTRLTGTVPQFVADPALQPQVCPDGRGFSDGPVALVDRNLRMAESFRTSLAVDHLLPWGVNATVEALYSKVRSDFLFVNADLKGPQAVDAHGRLLYGTIDPLGRGRPALVDAGRFPEVIDLRNHSLGYSWSVTAQIDRPFSDRYELRAAYTYSRARDLQSLTNPSAVAPFDIWAGGRPLSGRHDDLSTGVSTFEIPHRVVLAASYGAPWKRWKTDISLYYVGESGTPFTFGDSTAGGMGDLNADGTSANDPIYVPRNAADPLEIVFAGSDSAGQAAAFDKFIRDTPCLLRQRGRIVARNSCRGPWVNTSNASLRQSLQTIQGHDVSLQLEVFNLLNLINSSWGLLRLPNEKILQHVGQTSGTDPQPVFHFDAAKAGTSAQNLESGYQLQLSLRYSF